MLSVRLAPGRAAQERPRRPRPCVWDSATRTIAGSAMALYRLVEAIVEKAVVPMWKKQDFVPAAHNPDSMRAVCQVLEGSEWKNRKRVLIFAASADKDVRSMMSIIVPHLDEVVLTRFLGNPRSVPVAQLQEMAADILKDSESTPVIYGEESPKEALSQARRLAGEKDLICITGSIFLAAEVRGLLKAQMP